MAATGERSQDVVDYKVRRAVGSAALRRIDVLIRGWDEERQRSRRVALAGGIFLALALAGAVAWFYFSGSHATIPLAGH